MQQPDFSGCCKLSKETRLRVRRFLVSGCPSDVLVLEGEYLGRNLAQRPRIVADARLYLDKVDILQVGGAPVGVHGVGDLEIVLPRIAVGDLARSLVAACVVGVSLLVGIVAVVAVIGSCVVLAASRVP